MSRCLGARRRSALDISTAFDALGAAFNAFTLARVTCFYARLLDDERLPSASRFSPTSQLDLRTQGHSPRARGRLEEMPARSQDTPDDYVYDVFSDAMFPA